MYTRSSDINFQGIANIEEKIKENYIDYFNEKVQVFEYRNAIIFTVTKPVNDPEIIEIEVPCTSKEQYFTTSMRELADVIKYQRMNVKDFNIRDFLKSLDILVNVSKIG